LPLSPMDGEYALFGHNFLARRAADLVAAAK
jgi:hypothetical protein